MLSIIKYKLLVENFQQAEKLYFKNNKLPEDIKDVILNITNKDIHTLNEAVNKAFDYIS